MEQPFNRPEQSVQQTSLMNNPYVSADTQPPRSDGCETKVYLCSAKQLQSTVFGGFLIIFLIFFSVLCILVSSITTGHPLSIILPYSSAYIYCFFISLILSAAIAIYVRNSSNVRIEVNINGITFYRKKSPCSYYPLNTIIKILGNSTTPGDAGTDNVRQIIFSLPNGQEKAESLGYFTKETILKVAADIKNLRLYGKFDNGENAPAASFTPSVLQAEFHIIFPSVSKRAEKVAKQCPKCIFLYTDCIQVDSVKIPINVISKISMTSIGYVQTVKDSLNFRYLKIFTLVGSQVGECDYKLGRTTSQSCDEIFADYGILLSSVKNWCSDHNISYCDDFG